MKEYWGDPAATSKAITRDGWFRTGDLGFIDEEGFLYICDRIKDLIIRGGENIDSVSVENALYSDPAVLEAAAVGIPDERLGELVAACVVIQPGKVNEQQLISRARERLPRFAVPVMIVVMQQPLEKNASGKIVKTVLRDVVKAEWQKRKEQKARL
jgi:acyl-CoA synthetase (AMP-forming)/AMP-acid ligase II